jgi:hypothetical protein
MSANISPIALLNEYDVHVAVIRLCFGRVEVVCDWKPPDELLQASQGTDLHLSSHTLDEGGRLLTFDGPRAKPQQHGNLTVLPISIPEAAGRYRIQIDPVVEGRFWASNQGYAPLTLEAERMTTGDLVVVNPTQGVRYRLPVRPGQFRPDGPLYGFDDSERVVEIPWVLSRCSGATRILDVGYAHAQPRYVDARSALQVPLVVGIDPAAVPQQQLMGVGADALRPPFRKGSFDLIIAISVIEHIGRVNEIYNERRLPFNENGDLEAIRRLAELLLPLGRMLVTVPFGAYEDHGWFVQYDSRRIEDLVAASDCELNFAEYYACGGSGWFGPVAQNSLTDVRYRTAEGGAGAVACLELVPRLSRKLSSRSLGLPRRQD